MEGIQPFDYRVIAPGGVLPLSCDVTCNLCNRVVPYGDDVVYTHKIEKDFDVCEPCFFAYVISDEAKKFTKMTTMKRAQPVADRLYGNVLLTIVW